MEIKNEVLDQIFNSGEFQDKSDVKVSLFVISKKSPTLKLLNLEGLSPEKRLEKLRKVAQDNRFVAVVEKGDVLYAHVSPQFAERLSTAQDLSINGKKVAVKALSESEYERLAVVGETFEDYIRLNPEEGLQEEKNRQEDSRDRRNSGRSYVRQYFAKENLLSDVLKMDLMILQMRNIPEKIKLAFLQKMNEMQREIDRRKREEAAKNADKKYDILQTDLRKRIVKEEVIKEEVKHQNTKLEQVATASRKKAREEEPGIVPAPKKRKA
ncbi:hypothetical protein [Candidatus Protochlamydia phocaeensis]|uniref:hypothetical protein n=1 Tax=Candidatus Protochlamydia phocaeensis TaxID=1414722 RepID=UPI0008396FB1|nr:hypothetical protein [Candidatus Protochlamydia phocaeensis]